MQETREEKELSEDPLANREDLQVALMSILSDFDRVEETTRNFNVRIWKHCENYWHHIQNTYWSEYANDWRTPDFYARNNPGSEIDTVEMKIVNIYRAHGESIVAALSVGTPSVSFFPNDADSPDDMNTSRAKSKIAKMIERQNKAKLLLMRMIYILFNQGFVAVHNYSHESEEYGTIQTPIKKTRPAYFTNLLCSSCAEKLETLGPDLDGPIELNDEQKNTPVTCPTCGNQGIPIPENEEQETEYNEGYEEKPKCRQKLVAYGPLNVKVSSYATDQRNIGILVLDAEYSRAKAQDMYPNIAGRMSSGILKDDTAVNARMPNAMYDNYTQENVTVRKAWIRPYQFNSYAKVGDPRENKIVVELKKLFPNGVCLHAVNATYAETSPESLDAAWSISFNPLSRYVHADPIGMGLIPIQDMKNTMVNISLQSVEFGIPETFVDPSVLDFDAYKSQRGGPGVTFPIKAALPGQDIGKSFFERKPSTLTDEAGRLESRIDADGQFISGDYPSIYGGPNSGDTAAEYSMSRQQALQRLSTTWTILTFLWADVMNRAVDGYVANLKEDERYVDKIDNNFINVWIKKEELKGTTGECYPESSEQFPTSWSQQREILMNLIGRANPMIEAVLQDPNNRSQVATLIGLPDFTMPGDQDRLKQLSEISRLIQEEPNPPSGPNPTNPQDMGMPPSSSIQPEEKVDDHMVHIQACKHWMNSEVGQYFKENKPGAYMNVMLHMEEHEFMMQAMMPQGNPNEETPTPNK